MSEVCSKCGNDDHEKYYVKARVYGAIACAFRKALEEVVKHGSEPAAYIAKKALEWRESDRGGVPIEDVMAFGEHMKHDCSRAEIVAKLQQSVEEWRHDVEFSFPHLTEDHPCYQSEKECPYCGGINEHYTPPGGKPCALQRFFEWIEAGCPS